jgi:hypothetical protein
MKYPIKKIKITVLAVLSRLNLVLLFLSFVKKSDRNKRIKKKVEESPNPIPVILSKMENMPNIAKDRKREIDIISRQSFLLRKRITNKPGIINKTGTKIDASI